MLNKKFTIFIFSFLMGILFHSLFLDLKIDNSLLFFMLGISLLLSFFSFYFNFLKIIAIAIILFLLGFLRFDLSLHHKEKHIFDYFSKNNVEIVIDGKIVERPVRVDSSQSLVVNVQSISFGKTKRKVKTKILLKAFDYGDYRYGQIVRFRGIPKIPKRFDVDKGRSFDYEHFLEKDGIYYTLSSDDIEIIEDTDYSIYSLLYSLKDRLLEKIYRFIPKPEASLLAGILLGEKTALGDKLENNFRTTGLMHIVVLSGYNVSLVIIAVMIVLGFLPLYTRSILAVIGIVVFALLVGAGPTVIRASIMALFIVLAKVVGRPYQIERALLLAGTLMVIYNPWVLYYDISFQFSFLATYGLIVFIPILEEKLKFLPEKFALRDSASATISAQIMVAPLILYYIGDFSIISIFVNMLVLFMVPISMALGFITSLLGFFSSQLATIMAIPTIFSLKYILVLVNFFARIPFAKLSIHKFSFVWVFIYYIVLFILIFLRNKKTKQSLVT